MNIHACAPSDANSQQSHNMSGDSDTHNAFSRHRNDELHTMEKIGADTEPSPPPPIPLRISHTQERRSASKPANSRLRCSKKVSTCSSQTANDHPSREKTCHPGTQKQALKSLGSQTSNPPKIIFGPRSVAQPSTSTLLVAGAPPNTTQASTSTRQRKKGETSTYIPEERCEARRTHR